MSLCDTSLKSKRIEEPVPIIIGNILHYFSINGLRRFLKIRKEDNIHQGITAGSTPGYQQKERSCLPLLTTTIDFWNLRILVRQVKSDDVPKSSLT
jgi:hypothetical protein